VLIMNPMPALSPHLKQLRLSGILDSLEARNRQAIDAKLAYTEFLALLIEDEVARREQKKFTCRLRRAAFRSNKTLDQFDFDRLPQLNRALVHELATGRYLDERAPVLIVGPCGTGKSHLAQAPGPLRGAPGRRRHLRHLHATDRSVERGAGHRWL
jgi:DNA replication protein DnaC